MSLDLNADRIYFHAFAGWVWEIRFKLRMAKVELEKAQIYLLIEENWEICLFFPLKLRKRTRKTQRVLFVFCLILRHRCQKYSFLFFFVIHQKTFVICAQFTELMNKNKKKNFQEDVKEVQHGTRFSSYMVLIEKEKHASGILLWATGIWSDGRLIITCGSQTNKRK